MKPLIGTASLLAGQAVALAEALLAGRSTPLQVDDKTVFLFADLKRLRAAQIDLVTSSIIDAAFVLTTALRNACHVYQDDAHGAARADRWRELLGALVEHVRRESLMLNQEGHLT